REIGRLVLLRRPAHRPGPRERQDLPQGEPRDRRRDREGGARERHRGRREPDGRRRLLGLGVTPGLREPPCISPAWAGGPELTGGTARAVRKSPRAVSRQASW